MRRRQRSGCPVNFGVEIFGDTWTLLIIRDLMFEARSSYTEFLHAPEGIATNILADRLARLEEDGIVAKDRGVAQGVGRYRLTAKGIDLLPMMLEIIQWSSKYEPRTAPRLIERLLKDKAQLTKELRARLEADHLADEPGLIESGGGEE